MELTLNIHSSIDEFNASDWDSLNVQDNPFLKHCFFRALESSGSVSNETGWKVMHIAWHDHQGTLQAALPLYSKTHSYGEYMFDWAWAQGITNAGMRYYPKLLSAVPFTPVQGQRLMVSNALLAQDARIKTQLVEQLIKHFCDPQNDTIDYSNLQCLFINEKEAEQWQAAGAMLRRGYQFSWYNGPDNAQYKSFNDFLLTLKSSPRKKIKRERLKLKQSNIQFKCFEGDELSDAIWHFFIDCYQQTYLKRSGHEGYLNKSFFDQLKASDLDSLVVCCATENDIPIASSLFIKGNNILYGRYWGAMKLIDGLHFECCYYQGIDYCIDNAIKCFQPGTQGDYKRRRGFIPELTQGAYYFSDSNLNAPIRNYLNEEREQLEQQFEAWAISSPYKTL